MSEKIENGRVICVRTGVSQNDAKRKAEQAARQYAYARDYYISGRCSFTNVAEKLGGWTATASFKVVRQ